MFVVSDIESIKKKECPGAERAREIDSKSLNGKVDWFHNSFKLSSLLPWCLVMAIQYLLIQKKRELFIIE